MSARRALLFALAGAGAWPSWRAGEVHCAHAPGHLRGPRADGCGALAVWRPGRRASSGEEEAPAGSRCFCGLALAFTGAAACTFGAAASRRLGWRRRRVQAPPEPVPLCGDCEVVVSGRLGRISLRQVWARAHGHSHSEHGHDRHSHSDLEHGHEEHGHKEHGHEEHGHEDHGHSHSGGHSHAEHDGHGHGHGHGHGGLELGHGHAHGGDVPNWLPGAPLWRRVVKLAKNKVAMTTVTALFLASLLPVPWSRLRSLGPAAVFVVFGIPAICETLGHASRLDVHFLMTAAAFASAVIGHAHEGALLLLLFKLSEALEERLSLRARASLDALSKLNPEAAHRLPPGSESLSAAEDCAEVAAADLRAGDRILVRAGEVVPVDGEVVDGASQVGLEHLTGEPLPKAVSRGDSVMSGALSIDGALLLEVRRPAHESTIQRISRLTADAKATRPRLVTLLDAVAERWSYAVVASTAIIAVVPPLLLQAEVGPSLYRALVWLITASPCALILAAPMVYVSGLSVAAANGILLKGGRTLDALATASGVAFDKTGTITTGAPSLEKVEIAARGKDKDQSEEALRHRGLLLASALGRLSVHPVSRGLVAAAPAGERPSEVTDFEMVTGAGVAGSLAPAGEAPVQAVLGRPDFVASRLAALPGGAATAEAIRAAGAAGTEDEGAVAAFATCPAGGSAGADEGQAWLFHFKHRLKASAPEMLAEVSRGGPVYMLTGDRRANALRVAEQLGEGVEFAAIHADLRPEDKLARVKELDSALKDEAARGASLRAGVLKALGVSAGGLIMVGDGVNDAPALAAATAGISLAAQAEGALPTTVEGSDVLILPRAGDPAGDQDLERVGWLLRLSRKARRIVLQNILLATLSIGGASTLTLCTSLPLWIGVLLHEGTTMLVGLNSLRLFSQLKLRWRAPLRRRRGARS